MTQPPGAVPATGSHRLSPGRDAGFAGSSGSELPSRFGSSGKTEAVNRQELTERDSGTAVTSDALADL